MPINFIPVGDGTDQDDYILVVGNTTVDAKAGDDFVLADLPETLLLNSALNLSLLTAFNLDPGFVIGEGSLLDNDLLPTVVTFNEATIGTMEYYSLSLDAGSLLTVDIDLGSDLAIGISGSLVIELLDALGNVVATNSDGGLLDLGSSGPGDPFLSFTVGDAGTYYIRISQYEPITGLGTVFLSNTSYVMNVSATGHSVVPSTLAGNQTIYAGEGDDTVVVNGGDDTVLGEDGNDTIYGGSGNDTLDGGADDDTIYAGSGPADNSGGGQDTVHGGDGNDVLYSTGGGNYYGDAGDDLIYAGTSGVVAQQVFGGDGNDTLNTRSTNAATQINLITGETNSNLTVHEIENLITGDGNDVINGDNRANVIFTYGGDDRIYGRGSDDTINAGEGNNVVNGGTGADQMVAGSGDDVYFRDNVGDVIVDAGGFDYVKSTLSYTLLDGLENLVLLTSADINATGNSQNNILVGNHGNNVLDGRAGDDVMRGLNGDDTYIVDSLGDKISEKGTLGYDTVYSSVDFTLSEGLERLILTGTDAIDGYGNGSNNALYGNNAANDLKGLGGNDSLYGYGGDDRLFGNDGMDAIWGGAGSDFILGGAGRDVLYGDAGADWFVFQDGDSGNSFATADRIADFNRIEGDIIRLNLMDADTTMADNQGFSFIGTAGFSNHAGELRYEQIDGNTYVYGDTDGDGSADFMIRVDGLQTLVASDFIL